MAHSKIQICNIALASLGAGPIRAFDEDNKRARMCDVFFDICRDLLLSKFDWPFARKYVQLQQVDAGALLLEVPDSEYVYQLPADCRTPRDLQKRGNDVPWRVMGDKVYCMLEEDVYLFYTSQETNFALFTDTFANLLAMLMAVRMGPALTQDKDLVKSLTAQYGLAQAEAWESDANIGDNYREYDEDPNNDTFVNPDGAVETAWYER